MLALHEGLLAKYARHLDDGLHIMETARPLHKTLCTVALATSSKERKKTLYWKYWFCFAKKIS